MNRYTQTFAWQKYLWLANERKELFVNTGELDIVFDEMEINDYVEECHKELGIVYESDWHYMVVDLVRDRNGRFFTYERLIPRSTEKGVVIIPKYGDKYLLLHQYRHALRAMQYAFPRGYGEDDITSVENAQKELSEEIGAYCEVESFKYLGSIVANSGISGDKVDIYVVDVTGYQQNDSEGIKQILEVSEEELNQLIKTRQIDDGFTLSAVELLSKS